MKWLYLDNIIQYVDDTETVLGQVKKLGNLEWSWELFNTPNGYGRAHKQVQAQGALNDFCDDYMEAKALRDIAVELHTKVLEYKHLEMLYSSDMSKMLLSYIEQAYRLGRI